MAYVKIIVHCVWSTKNRLPQLVNRAHRIQLFEHIRINALSKGIFIVFSYLCHYKEWLISGVPKVMIFGSAICKFSSLPVYIIIFTGHDSGISLLLYQFYSIKKGYFYILPAAGYRDHGSGSSNGLAFEGDYWSSTLGEVGLARRLYFTGSVAKVDELSLAYGFSVRCVQAFTGHSFYYLCSPKEWPYPEFRRLLLSEVRCVNSVTD
ncbi:fibrobacter succinogenes major paralogous domain-containing protein [Parabacteroides provencensis]|uniref:hypothetical protein n=1 Tax=Parabacteroides provencensis TaxID=1944636 RepID=UPI000C151BA0|nr:hypothetical protein [Parabacteroides provencensis]